MNGVKLVGLAKTNGVRSRSRVASVLISQDHEDGPASYPYIVCQPLLLTDDMEVSHRPNI